MLQLGYSEQDKYDEEPIPYPPDGCAAGPYPEWLPCSCAAAAIAHTIQPTDPDGNAQSGADHYEHADADNQLHPNPFTHSYPDTNPFIFSSRAGTSAGCIRACDSG